MWKPTNHSDENVEKFKERVAEAGLRGVVCHALYLVNLAAPDEGIYERSVTALSASVDTACRIGADAVIFHTGSHLGAGLEAGLDRVVPALARCLERCADDTWLLIENTAGTGATIGRSIEELAAVVDRLGRHERLGICLDSCHLYASGYDVTDRKALDAVLRQVDREIGLDRLRALHLNDSQTPLGSNRDRHANLGEGEMGDGIATFLKHPKLRKLAAYLEVPGKDDSGPDAEQVARAKALRDM
jgi:deoxyribonuclease-4